MQKETKIVKDIIKKYGDVIDMKKNPHILIEILRHYRDLIGISEVVVCSPPGGPPKKQDIIINPAEMSKLIGGLKDIVLVLDKKMDKFKK
jgi:hypothetical protein